MKDRKEKETREKEKKPSSQGESNLGPFDPLSDALPLELPPRPKSLIV